MRSQQVHGAFSLNRLASAEVMTWVLGIILGILYVTGVIVFGSSQQLVDERFHVAQETLFFHAHWRFVPELTTIPGYHLLLAGVMRLLGTNELGITRVVHAILCLTAVVGFFALRRRLWPGTETIASAQFLCLPLMATLFFVIYTDVPAVSLLLWATWAAIAGRTFICALLLCLLVLVRQHEFLWSVFLIAIVARPASGWSEFPQQWRTRFTLVFPLICPIALFLAYWGWNGTISLSQTQALVHPDLTFHTGNVLVGVLMIGLLLPVQAAKGIGSFARQVSIKPWLLLAPVCGFLAFLFALQIDHPYNGAIAVYLHQWMPTRLSAALIVAAALCYFPRVKLIPAGAGLPLVIVSAIFLTASWLVEPRYLIAPISLWLAMRQHEQTWIELVTLVYWLVLAAMMIFLAMSAGFIL
jgi:alpha-1,2-glucosyltransferase